MWQKDRRPSRSSEVCLLLLCMFTWNTHAEDPEALVVTKQGLVRGAQLPSPSGPVNAFLGIPYGEPPTGSLRFKKPVPIKPWKGILNATKYGNSCYQIKDDAFPGFIGSEMWNPNTELSEDCVHLNVWVPSTKPTRAPVLVFIHGGGFETGTCTLDVYDGRILAQTEGVIVSMNYRLGALGFLALPENPEISGNAGLFDQQLALQWVQENIAAFGGDPGSVTLFGQSAGAGAVGYHMLSPSSRPLFTRAIMQSGSPNGPWALMPHREARNMASKLIQLLGCSDSNTTDVVACLQTKSAQAITHHQNSVLSHEGFAITRFVPTVDGDFLTDTPDMLIKEQKVKQGEVLIGVTVDEGTILLFYGPPGFSKDNESLITTAQFEEGVKEAFPEAGELGLASIIFQYTDWKDENNPVKNRNALNHPLTDYHFACPTASFVKHLVEHGKAIFIYLFAHRAVQEVWPEWAGVMHGAEIPFVFGAPLDPKNNYTKAEVDLSRKMMRSWGNFARIGSPNGAGVEESGWLNSSSTDQNYAILNTEPLQIQRNLGKKAECVFWDSYFPKVLKITGNLTVAITVLSPFCQKASFPSNQRSVSRPGVSAASKESEENANEQNVDTTGNLRKLSPENMEGLIAPLSQEIANLDSVSDVANAYQETIPKAVNNSSGKNQTAAVQKK
ncbi:cholinesterase-like [Ambystoma mexicanum]|uniref:cholinesterase-like n=1 Tax=Ambystoma mexicanum TaxID=8296 RepID=UPI0037E8ED6C